MDKNYNIYKYVSSLTKRDTFLTTMYHGSECGVCDYDKAHLFNQYFLEILQFPQLATISSASDTDTLENISISPEEVYEVLVSLDPNKTQGIDCLSPKIWKTSAPHLSKPLCYLFTKCLLNSTLPSE